MPLPGRRSGWSIGRPPCVEVEVRGRRSRQGQQRTGLMANGSRIHSIAILAAPRWGAGEGSDEELGTLPGLSRQQSWPCGLVPRHGCGRRARQMPRRLNTASRLFGDEPEKAGAEVVRQCRTPGSSCRRDRVRVVFLPGMRSEISHASWLGIQSPPPPSVCAQMGPNEPTRQPCLSW